MSSGRLSAQSLSGLPQFVSRKNSRREILPPPDLQLLNLNMRVALCFSTCYCLICKATAAAVVQISAYNLKVVAANICLRKAPSGAPIKESLVIQGPLVKWCLAIAVASASCRHLPKWLRFLAAVYLTEPTAPGSVETSSKIFSARGIHHELPEKIILIQRLMT